MPGKNFADIVFCIDSSGSMQNTIDQVCSNMNRLIESITEDKQVRWDVRFDFCAFHDSKDHVHHYSSVRNGTSELIDAIYRQHKPSSFFTSDRFEFMEALKKVPVEGEEMQLLALDVAMDYPWRASSDVHRAIILLSDEPVETGLFVDEQVAKIPDLVSKLMRKRIKLFIVAPESVAFARLSEADRCEYEDISEQGDGLKNVNFNKLLAAIGKSISISQSDGEVSNQIIPLFGQGDWTTVSDVEWGLD